MDKLCQKRCTYALHKLVRLLHHTTTDGRRAGESLGQMGLLQGCSRYRRLGAGKTLTGDLQHTYFRTCRALLACCSLRPWRPAASAASFAFSSAAYGTRSSVIRVSAGVLEGPTARTEVLIILKIKKLRIPAGEMYRCGKRVDGHLTSFAFTLTCPGAARKVPTIR